MEASHKVGPKIIPAKVQNPPSCTLMMMEKLKRHLITHPNYYLLRAGFFSTPENGNNHLTVLRLNSLELDCAIHAHVKEYLFHHHESGLHNLALDVCKARWNAFMQGAMERQSSALYHVSRTCGEHGEGTAKSCNRCKCFNMVNPVKMQPMGSQWAAFSCNPVQHLSSQAAFNLDLSCTSLSAKQLIARWLHGHRVHWECF